MNWAREDSIEALLVEREIIAVLLLGCRSTDRGDIANLRSTYHPDAHIEMGYYSGPAQGFCDRLAALGGARDTPISRVQHQLSNITCSIRENQADVESYIRVVRRRRDADGDWDEIVASRALDCVEHKHGRWAISHRQVIWDWMSSVPATPSFWEGDSDFHVGARGIGDLTTKAFPAAVDDRPLVPADRWRPQP